VINALSQVSGKTTQTKATPLQRALKVFYGRPEPLFFKNASAGLYKDFAQVEAYIDKALDIVIASPGMIYQVNTLGGNIVNAEFEAGASFPHRAFPFFSELQAYWEGEKQGQRLMARFQQVQEVFNSNGITAQYRNYPDINFKNFGSLYYGSNHARLQAVKFRYDPKDLIRHEQSLKGN
jgi:Berberine and berberine like